MMSFHYFGAVIWCVFMIMVNLVQLEGAVVKTIFLNLHFKEYSPYLFFSLSLSERPMTVADCPCVHAVMCRLNARNIKGRPRRIYDNNNNKLFINGYKYIF